MDLHMSHQWQKNFDTYGMITHEEFLNNVKTYYVLDANGNFKESHAAHMWQQMLVCICN